MQHPSVGLRQNLRALLTLAAPIAVSQVAQLSMGFVDTAAVGRLGPTELAAVALGANVQTTTILLCLGTVQGGGPLIAQAFGADDAAGVSRYARQTLWSAVLLTPAAMLVAWTSPLWLPYLGQPAEIEPIVIEYLRTVAWSALPFLLFSAVRAWMESLNRPLPVTAFTVAAVGLNAVTDYVLVYGHYGFPALGVEGAAYATVASYAFLFVACAAYSLYDPDLRRYGVLDRWRPLDFAALGELLRVGVPIGISFGIESGLFTATAILMGAFGTVALSAHQISVQLAAMAFMLPLSVAIASTIRVGNLVGADRPGDARQTGWLGIGAGGLIMGASATVFLLAPVPLIRIFTGPHTTENLEVVRLATGLLALAGAFQVVDGLQATAVGALRGLADTFYPMVIGVACYWGVGFTSGYFLAQVHGPRGLWMGLVVGLALASVALGVRWHRLSRGL